MLASIRARWGHRGTQPPATAASATPAPAEAGSQALSADSLVLLVPTEGGLSFYLHSVPDLGSARKAANGLPPALRQKVIVFRATHRQPQEIAGSERPAEAVVMTRDPGRPDVVQLSSFVDMESAR